MSKNQPFIVILLIATVLLCIYVSLAFSPYSSSSSPNGTDMVFMSSESKSTYFSVKAFWGRNICPHLFIIIHFPISFFYYMFHSVGNKNNYRLNGDVRWWWSCRLPGSSNSKGLLKWVAGHSLSLYFFYVFLKLCCLYTIVEQI